MKEVCRGPGDGNIFVIMCASAGFGSMGKVTNRFVCFAGQLQTVEDIRSMFFYFLE